MWYQKEIKKNFGLYVASFPFFLSLWFIFSPILSTVLLGVYEKEMISLYKITTTKFKKLVVQNQQVYLSDFYKSQIQDRKQFHLKMPSLNILSVPHFYGPCLGLKVFPHISLL